MHRRQICELEFAFYVHYFTVYFTDHDILVCEQALYFFIVASNELHETLLSRMPLARGFLLRAFLQATVYEPLLRAIP